MGMRNVLGAVVLLGAVALATPASASAQAKMPEGVTAATIEKGKAVFTGAGNCWACHGKEAKGMVGPNLTDAEWLHGKGEYAEIVTIVTQGISKEQAKKGIPMPAKGGSAISDDDAKAAAAYVWSLSHGS